MINLELNKALCIELKTLYEKDKYTKYAPHVYVENLLDFSERTCDSDTYDNAVKAFKTRFSKKIKDLYIEYDVFANKKKLTVCPICNMNTMPLYINNEKKYYKCQLDHNKPKTDKKHVHLVNNFYNLVPICSVCNHIKSDSQQEFYNPLIDNAIDEYKFEFTNETFVNWELKRELSLDLKDNDEMLYQNWINGVDLKERIKLYSNVVEDRLNILYKNRPNDKILKEIYGENDDALLLSLKFTEEDYMTIPFSKIINDAIQQYMNIKE